MRLQRFGKASETTCWQAECACGAWEANRIGETRKWFLRWIQEQGWSEDAKGRPLCPKCAKAKGETT